MRVGLGTRVGGGTLVGVGTRVGGGTRVGVGVPQGGQVRVGTAVGVTVGVGLGTPQRQTGAHSGSAALSTQKASQNVLQQNGSGKSGPTAVKQTHCEHAKLSQPGER